MIDDIPLPHHIRCLLHNFNHHLQNFQIPAFSKSDVKNAQQHSHADIIPTSGLLHQKNFIDRNTFYVNIQDLMCNVSQ
jgi:hypothetical protein